MANDVLWLRLDGKSLTLALSDPYRGGSGGIDKGSGQMKTLIQNTGVTCHYIGTYTS